MLAVTILYILIQFVLALMDARRFVYFSLWTQSIPYWWNFDIDTTIDTPIGPVNIGGMKLFGSLLAYMLAILPNIDRAFVGAKQYKWHLIFIVFCVVSLAWAPSVAYGARMIAKLLGPLLFMIVVRTVIRSQVDFKKTVDAILGSGVIVLAIAFLAKASGVQADPNAGTDASLAGLGPPGLGPPVFCAHMLPIAMLALASYITTTKPRILILAILSAVGIVAAQQRTSAGALLIGFSVVVFFGTRGVRRFILPIAAVLSLPALLLLNESFRRRMFFGDATSETLLADPTQALGSVNSSGRFKLWDDVLRRFFDPHPIFGSGIGATQNYLYTQAVKGATVVHSEYIRLICEVGIVGLGLFILAVGTYFIRLKKHAVSSGDPFARAAALGGLGSLVAYLVYFTTDNGIDYVNTMGIYVFAIIAVAENSGQTSDGAAPGRSAGHHCGLAKVSEFAEMSELASGIPGRVSGAPDARQSSATASTAIYPGSKLKINKRFVSQRGPRQCRRQQATAAQ